MARLIRLLLVISLSALLLMAGGTYWLLNTSSGLNFALQLASTLSGGRLQTGAAEGRLLGPLSIDSLHWHEQTLTIRAETLAFDWQARDLLERKLNVSQLDIGTLQIQLPDDETASSPPTDLQLPLAIHVERLRIDNVQYGAREVLRALSLQFSSDGRQHRIDALHLDSADIAVRGKIQLDGEAPFPLAVEAELQGQLEDRPLALAVTASGPLARIAVEAHSRAGIEGSARLLIEPFAPMPFSAADIRLSKLDPAAWQAGLPDASLDVDIHIQPQGDGLLADVDLRNTRPSSVDRGGLPLTQLRGQVSWLNGQLEFPALHASIAGGEVSGKGNWLEEEGVLELQLTISRFDAIRLHSQLRPTRLAGTLNGRFSQHLQQAQVTLRDSRFSVAGEFSQENGLLNVTALTIASGPARLRADGELALEQMQFRVEGRLQDFDPARFADLPSARINASLQAQGSLQPAIVVDASFSLADSHFRQQALAGQGELQLAWPALKHLRLDLDLAGNRLKAQGGFGQPGQTLQLDIDAPRLAALGAEGDLKGALTLSGTPTRPLIAGDIRAQQLGWPGLFRLQALQLAANLADAADAPMHLELSLAHLASGSGAPLFSALKLQGEGSRQQHRIHFQGQLGSGETLQLSLAGSERDGAWQGSLDALALRADSAARNLRLQAPAALRVSRSGWSAGPMQLAGDPLDWLATLQADASAQALRLDLQASGSRIGQVQARLQATMDSPWQLAADRPWQGTAAASIKDLGWLGELIGNDWQTGGQLEASLGVSGTPGQPSLTGTLQGQALSLRQPGQGLHLNDGMLSADLRNNLLNLRQLSFASPRERPPRPLRLALGDDARRLEGPGRLEISGEMRVGEGQSEGQAALSIRLDRVGISQRQDQWLSLSGDGRLRWQDAAFDIEGKLGIDAAYWQLAPAGAPRLSDDVVVHRAGAAKTPTPRPNLSLALSVDLGRHFLFEGAGLSTRLAGQVNLAARGRDLPRATGTIRTRDGRFEAYGQRLDITRGILTFQGLPDNPALDVRAVRRGLPVEPGVELSGTAQRPVVRLISDPDMPDNEKLSWLILGHGPESVGIGDASVLLSAAGGLLGNDSGNLVAQLKQTFGIDDFGVRQGNLDGSGGRQPGSRVVASGIDTSMATGNQILSIGKRLSSSATLSYEQSLGTAESIVKLSVELTRQITLVGRAGSDNALDVFYTLTWGLPPTSRRQSSRRQPLADTAPED